MVLKNLRAFVAKKKGSFKPAFRFTTGHSGEWRHATFELEDARFATESDGKDILLYVNKNEDFVVQGVYVRELERGKKTRQEGEDTMKGSKVEQRD